MKTTAAIRDAFGRGDIAAIVALHHPTVVKFFGGTNVVNGRVELERGLVETFRNSRMQFIENDVESTLLHGDTAVETSIFAIKVTFKDGRLRQVQGQSDWVGVDTRDDSGCTGTEMSLTNDRR